MLERDAGRKLEGEVQVNEACLMGEHPDGKRGRGSESKMPFLAAMQVTAEGRPALMKTGVVEGFRKNAVEEWSGESVKPGTTVNTDGPGCFTGFAAAGCEHALRVTGGGPGSCEPPGLCSSSQCKAGPFVSLRTCTGRRTAPIRPAFRPSPRFDSFIIGCLRHRS